MSFYIEPSKVNNFLEIQQNFVKRYIERRWCPIPIPLGSKSPNFRGWQNQTIGDDTLSKFSQPCNIGLLLGESSNGLTDIDLDALEAVKLAALFFPATKMIHGRTGKPKSHRWYRPEKLLSNHKFTDIDGTCLLEIRTKGQTVVPPSYHPSKELLQWEDGLEPAIVTAQELLEAAVYTAVTAILGRHWPKKEGHRHDIALAAAGLLIRFELETGVVCKIVEHAAQIGADEQAEKRIRDVLDTDRRLSDGKDATGGPTLVELLPNGAAVVAKIKEWMKLLGRASKSEENSFGQSGGGGKGPTQATILVRLAQKAEVTLWHTPDDEPYATVLVKDYRENWPVHSKKFRNWLCKLFYRELEKAPGSQGLQDAMNLLAAHAIHDGLEHTVFVRIAEAENIIYVDLANHEGEIVEITADGWRIVKDVPVHFRRTRGMRSLPKPEKGGNIDELRPFINIENDSGWKLYVAWLVGAFRPKGPYIILILEGEQGSGKSMTSRISRELIDPSAVPLKTIFRDERDLMITAANSWLLCFDNLSGVRVWVSDALCRLATGGGLSTRELYTNAEETLFDAQRPLILNGIDEIATRGDLMDRAIRLNSPSISEDKRKDQKKLWEEFEAAKSRIFGALLDAICTALKRLPDIHLEQLPRMADFAIWVTAAEPALGWPEGTFLRAYAENRLDSANLAIEGDIVASAVSFFLVERKNQEWEGSATELLLNLSVYVTDDVKRSRAWPKSPRWLSDRLRRVAPQLLQHGVKVEMDKREAGTGRRLITIGKTNV